MSNFTKQIAKTFEFDGDKVTVTMRRMKRKDALKLTPYMREEDENGEVKLTLDEQFNMMDVGAALLQKNVVNFSGLYIEGAEVTKTGNSISNEELWDDVFNDVYFIDLLSSMLNFLLDKSFLKKDQAKNSEGPSENSSAAIEHTNQKQSEAVPPSNGSTRIGNATESECQEAEQTE